MQVKTVKHEIINIWICGGKYWPPQTETVLIGFAAEKDNLINKKDEIIASCRYKLKWKLTKFAKFRFFQRKASLKLPTNSGVNIYI